MLLIEIEFEGSNLSGQIDNAVEWMMVLDAQSQLTDTIKLEDKSAKGKSGGVIYISSRLAAVLADYADGRDLTGTIIKSRSG